MTDTEDIHNKIDKMLTEFKAAGEAFQQNIEDWTRFIVKLSRTKNQRRRRNKEKKKWHDQQ